MSYNEEAWRRYVLGYYIKVPQEDVEKELYLIRADMKHRMMYEQMSGGVAHPFPEIELEEQADQQKKNAVIWTSLSNRHSSEILILTSMMTKKMNN